MKSNMNLPQFLNDEFFVKYEKVLELAKVRVGDVYFGGLKTFCLKTLIKFTCYLFLKSYKNINFTDF